MYDYMKALHKVLPGAELHKKPRRNWNRLTEKSRRVRPADQEILLQLADLENELREETSLTSFIAVFSLGMGIAGEMERYCFEDEEEKRVIERAKAEHPRQGQYAIQRKGLPPVAFS
ncbi:hypothetical protein [Dysosmobacter welbionis]|uniref:hypothetical protein n=1 Tax=Dysosmobacter welbionis TaxID=2093857 RepID=UPI002352AD28|nr:hypothetical protein [Dysosmobacter welbionis]